MWQDILFLIIGHPDCFLLIVRYPGFVGLF